MEGLEQFKQTFFQECEELLADLEGQLMALEGGDRDLEVLHAAFRAIHSIKGGAGAFGFERLVAFAHTFETVLDLMREGKVALSDELVSLTVRGGDTLADLVNAARAEEDLPPGTEDELLKNLAVAAGLDPAGESAAEDGDNGGDGGGDLDDFDFVPVPVDLDGGDDGDEAPAEEPAPEVCYRIEFRPKREMIQRANEPLLLIRELRQLGSLTVTADLAGIPPLEELEPDDAYLAWTFELNTTAEREAVQEVFEFVEDDCELTIECLSEAAAEDPADEPEAEPEGQAPAGEPAGPDTSDAAPAGAGAATADEPVQSGDDAPAAQEADQASAPVEAPVEAPAEAPASKPAEAPKAPAAAAAANAGGAKPKPPAATAIRVDLDRVDRLVNMVGELIITQAVVAQQVDQDLAESHPALAQGLEQLFHHTRNLQDSVMAIRAQPVRSVFSRMPRLVRDLAVQTGKKVRIEMSGEATEIDKTVIEQLNDPLTHMIRNAVDHGLESADEREAAGKPAEGLIHLSAEQRGGRIVIQIIDDGKGINREKVLNKAIEKGLIAADANLTDEEVDNLVFLPGFSTADQVSNLSGRGVGMDVVKQNIQSLGGRVSIRSEPGRGSNVVLTLPLTLAVLDGMIVRAGGDSYIIPLTNVIESLSPQAQDVHLVAGSGDVLRIRGDYIKLVDLQAVFSANPDPDSSGELIVLVEVEGGHRVGLMVEEILGQQQVVIKSLEENFDPIPGIAGATILGDGKVALILDVTAVSELHRQRGIGTAGSFKARVQTEEQAA